MMRVAMTAFVETRKNPAFGIATVIERCVPIFELNLSLRDVEEMPLERGMIVSGRTEGGAKPQPYPSETKQILASLSLQVYTSE